MAEGLGIQYFERNPQPFFRHSIFVELRSIQGLLRLLLMALRLLTVMEFHFRQALANQQETLAGLYVGNPKRATAQPTSELLLAQFRDITLTLLQVPPDLYLHITLRTPLQQKILALLNFPESIY